MADFNTQASESPQESESLDGIINKEAYELKNNTQNNENKGILICFPNLEIIDYTS